MRRLDLGGMHPCTTPLLPVELGSAARIGDKTRAHGTLGEQLHTQEACVKHSNVSHPMHRAPPTRRPAGRGGAVVLGYLFT